jgi:hypothetical protein
MPNDDDFVKSPSAALRFIPAQLNQRVLYSQLLDDAVKRLEAWIILITYLTG